MMRQPDSLDEGLRAVAAGQLDSLSPELIARLERALAQQPRIADTLRDAALPIEPGLSRAIQAFDQSTAPTKAAWGQVWERIDRVGDPGWATTEHFLRGWWRPLLAAAACALLALTWHFAVPSAQPWPMQLATEVEINEIEVYDGATPFVISTDDGSGLNVIWFLQDES
jgi:hypothetical protein